MRERIPHDYLILMGVAAIFAGLLFPMSLTAGLAAAVVWVIAAIVVIIMYR